MKKLIYSLSILGGLAVAAFPVASEASIITFTQTLQYGMTGSAVTALQQFLFDQDYLKTAPTGGFFGKTQAALEAFQTSQGISPTGYFGPITMAAANAQKIATAKPAAMVAIQSVSDANSQVAAVFGSLLSKTVTWQTSGYPAGLGVDINLIKKVSDSPISYTLVRQIATNVPNSGSYSWVPRSGENSADLYVEVTCPAASTATVVALGSGCQISTQPVNVQ
jgi:peptidoglycan hydrolase-like protein with peptidoglycan-binding domain